MKKTLLRGALPLCLVAVLMFSGACASSKNDLSKWKDEEPFKKEDISKYISLGEYKNLKVDDSRLQKVENNDFVIFDFEGTAPGISEETLQNMKAERYDQLVVGSGEFIPGFEEQMLGQVVGKPFEVKVTFPEDYAPEGDPAEELNGKEVTFHCLVHEIPNKAANLAIQAAYETVTLIKIPEREKEMYLKLFNAQAESYGMTEEELMEEVGGLEQWTAGIEERIAQEMFVYAIARQEGLESTQAELQVYLNRVRESNPGVTSQEILDQSGGKNLLMRDLTREKVIDFVYENAKNKK